MNNIAPNTPAHRHVLVQTLPAESGLCWISRYHCREVAGSEASTLPRSPALASLEQARCLVTWAAASLWREMTLFRLYFSSSSLGLLSWYLGRVQTLDQCLSVYVYACRQWEKTSILHRLWGRSSNPSENSYYLCNPGLFHVP